MKLWIDDIRTPPDSTWTWAKTSMEAMAHIRTREVGIISFDHDLGGEDTSMPAARLVEKLAFESVIPRLVWHIHSQNPVGRDKIRMCMESAERFWSENERNVYGC